MIIYGIKDGLFDSISIGACVISTVVRQQNNPQSTQVLKRIRQCCFLSGFLMVCRIHDLNKIKSLFILNLGFNAFI